VGLPCVLDHAKIIPTLPFANCTSNLSRFSLGHYKHLEKKEYIHEKQRSKQRNKAVKGRKEIWFWWWLVLCWMKWTLEESCILCRIQSNIWQIASLYSVSPAVLKFEQNKMSGGMLLRLFKSWSSILTACVVYKTAIWNHKKRLITVTFKME
jgi:hypothetical protein